MSETSPNLAALGVYLASFIGYNLLYLWLTSASPHKTKKGRINQCIDSWLRKTLEKGEYLLIVHQIRNILMAVTFLATTSILLMGLLFNFIPVQELIPPFPASWQPGHYVPWLIILTLGFSFLNLLLALRHFNHFSVLIRSSPESLREVEGMDHIKYLGKLFVSGSHRYMLGRRGFLYAVTVLSWYLNVWIFVALTLALTAYLSYSHDF